MPTFRKADAPLLLDRAGAIVPLASSLRVRDAPPSGPLPPRPRQTLPAYGQARAGAGAPRHRNNDLSRDGDDVLVGAGGSGEGLNKGRRAWSAVERCGAYPQVAA